MRRRINGYVVVNTEKGMEGPYPWTFRNTPGAAVEAYENMLGKGAFSGSVVKLKVGKAILDADLTSATQEPWPATWES